MRAEWEPDELIDAWTLVEGDWEMVGAKAGATAGWTSIWAGWMGATVPTLPPRELICVKLAE